jgi:hypothetical protein
MAEKSTEVGRPVLAVGTERISLRLTGQMDFTQRKLPRTAAGELRRLNLGELQPFALMFSPVYVFLRRNEKFIGIKAPLDFFIESEIEKVRPYGALFVLPFVDQVAPYREAGRRARKILSARDIQSNSDESGYPEVKLPPPPWEVSDSILRVVGPLWGREGKIEPFFVTAFVQDLCGSLPGDLLLQSRDSDISTHEKALIRSSWAVFLALHLGFCELSWLIHLRARVFAETSQLEYRGRFLGDGSDVPELIHLTQSHLFDDEGLAPLSANVFQFEDARVALKLYSRLERVKKEFSARSTYNESIRGQKGFLANG